MEDNKKKIIKQNLIRKRFCGKTPEQVRKLQQRPLRESEIKSFKDQRLTSLLKKSKTTQIIVEWGCYLASQ